MDLKNEIVELEYAIKKAQKQNRLTLVKKLKKQLKNLKSKE